ncbi:hypothetical protein [Pantoea cypripedii]|uniref:Uncharacterized protein n=1 Tax=Pantoea cypripedii TaxID=55209 RepID=A0A6B9FZS3_PANCY|nr:hypothetical protein [Pantoea cypripedii]QGY29768.1 hypothetical protein CUN67_12850 [Pantoea cypripedii]
MAYATTNPPALLQDRIGGGGAVWSYKSTDTIGTVLAANYFTNGEALGLKAGDQVNVIVDASPALMYPCYVSAVTDSGATIVQVKAGATGY